MSSLGTALRAVGKCHSRLPVLWWGLLTARDLAESRRGMVPPEHSGCPGVPCWHIPAGPKSTARRGAGIPLIN